MKMKIQTLIAPLLVITLLLLPSAFAQSTSPYGVELEVQDSDIQLVDPGYSVVFQILVKNTATGIGGIGIPDTMTLELTKVSEPEGWNIVLDKSSVSVVGGESESAKVTVFCAENATSGDEAIFTVTATSSNAEQFGGATDTTPQLKTIARTQTPLDRDGDGLDDNEEYLSGTDPDKYDTDGDGFGDGNEVLAGTDPLDKESFPGRSNAGYIALISVIGLALAGVIGIVIYWRISSGIRFKCNKANGIVDLDKTGSKRYVLLIENREHAPDTITFDIVKKTEGWSAFLDTPALTLHGNERRMMGLTVVTPSDAKPGEEGTVEIRAKSEEGKIEKIVAITTRCTSSKGGA